MAGGLLIAAGLAAWGCQSSPLFDDRAFDTLVSQGPAVPYSAADAPPRPAEPLGAGQPFEDGPQDLAFLIAFALQNNPTTRATWERAKAAAAEWQRIESLYLPVLYTRGFAGYMQDAIPAQDGPFLAQGASGDIGVDLTWLLVDFGRRDALSEKTHRALLASNLTFNRALQTLVYEVQTAYYALDAAIALEETAMQGVETSRVQMDAVDDKLRHGLAIMPDVLIARQRWEQARFKLEAARSGTFDARGTLASRLGLPADVAIEIRSLQGVPLPPTLTEKVETLMAVGGTDRPDLLAATQRVRAAEAQIRKAEADFLPTVSLYGSVANRWFNYTPDPVGASNQYDATLPTYAIGLKGTWLLFDGFERVNAVRQARAERNAAAAELAALRLKALNDVWEAYFQQLAAQRQFVYGQSLLVASQDSYDAMFEAYVNGLRTLPQLLQAELDLAAARSTLIETRADLLDSSARLAWAVGSPDMLGRYARRPEPTRATPDAKR